MSKLIIALYTLFTCLGLVLFKLGASSEFPITFSEGKLNFNPNGAILIGVASYGLSFVLYLYLISKYDLGYIMPILAGLVYVIVFIASALIFKEAFSTIKIVGITLIISGLFLLNI